MKILYKYLVPDRLDVLRNARIRYSQPPVFNDPFESRPHIVGMPPMDLMEKVSRIEQERIGFDEETRQSVLKISRDPERARQVYGMMLNFMTGTIGVLSLTEKCDNLLMWAHYAFEHTGFVLGFDTTHEYWNHFDDKKPRTGVLRKLNYSEKRPTLQHMAEMTLIDIYFSKSLEWAYEQEWRVFKTLDRATQILNEQAKYPVYLFDFPRESVSEIVIGCRATDDFQKSVVELVRATPEYAKTRVLRAEIDDAEFKLIFHEF